MTSPASPVPSHHEPELPAARILRLAAFLAARGRTAEGLTLTDLVDGATGYGDAARDDRGEIVAEGRGWETLRRKVRRDLGDLRDHWGIDVTYDEATHRYRLAPAHFSPPARRSLLAAAATVHVEGAGSGGTDELGATLDDARAQVVLFVHDLVGDCAGAIRDRSLITFRYAGRTRLVAPLATGTWRTHWYLAAWDQPSGELRRFRLDRIERGVPTIETVGEPDVFTPPVPLDRAALFDLDPNSWGGDELAHATVRVHPDHRDAFLAAIGGVVVDERGDEVVIAVDVRHHQSFRTRLLAFRGAAVVLAPPTLVDQVRAHLTTLVEAR